MIPAIEQEALRLDASPQNTPEIGHGRLRSVGRFVGKLSIYAGLGMIGGFLLAERVPADVTIGPHDAKAYLTHDNNATFDLGFPGELVKPLDTPLAIGGRLDIGGIPDHDEDIDPRQPGFSEEDIQEYATLFADFEDDVNDIKKALFYNWLRLSVISTGIALALPKIIQVRPEIFEQARAIKNSKTFRVGVATAAVGSILIPQTVAASGETAVPVDKQFVNTPLEGMKVRGEQLKDLINTWGVKGIELLKENDAFYDEVFENIQQAYETGDPLIADEHSSLMLFSTDEHCNIGMMEVIGRTAELFKAKATLHGGDITVSGSEIEEVCVRVMAHYSFGEQVVASGNHDSAEIERDLKDEGFKVLDGEPMNIAGLRMLGDDDPNRSAFGQGTQAERNETNSEMGRRLANVACDDKKGVDILLVHNPEATKQIFNRGCVPLILSGHMHHEKITYNHPDRLVVHLNGGSAAGSEHDRLSIDKPNQPAPFYVLRFSERTKRLTHIQTIIVNPDGSVQLSVPNIFPIPLSFSENSVQ